MTRLRVVWVLIAVVLGRAGWGQTDAGALERELKGKQLALRSYSAEPVAKYEWLGDKLVGVPGHVFTLGTFKVGSVWLKGGTLALIGERYTLVRDSKKNQMFAMGGAPMRLEIDLHGATPAEVVPKLKEMLFVEDLHEVIAGLPPTLANMLPTDLSDAPAATGCKCARLFRDGSWIIAALPDAQYIPIRVKSTAEPEFSEEARRQKMSATVKLALFVADTGLVGDVWILEPAGNGLDENAVAAARKYIFAPAQYEGKPVGTEVRVEIAFSYRE